MHREKLINEIGTLERKLMLLLNAYRGQQEELDSLKLENEQLKRLLTNRDKELDNFKNQVKISSIVNRIAVDGNDTAVELKSQISTYIKEIDKCITHLSQS